MHPLKKGNHRSVELCGPLQRCEMTHAGEDDQLRTGNTPSKILGVFALDEFIVLAVDDGHRQADLGQLNSISPEIDQAGPIHITFTYRGANPSLD